LCFIAGLLMLSQAAVFAGEMFSDQTGSAAAIAMPKTPVQKSYTSFTPALRCMDDLFLQNNTKNKNLWITTIGIPDSTGKVSAGTREMLINALARMTQRSKAIKYLDYSDTDFSREGAELKNLFARWAENHDAPKYYIRGAISQLDDNAVDSQKGGGIALPFLDIGMSKGETASVVTLDMTIGDASTRELLPETATSNSMIVVKTDKGGEGGGKIGKLGLQLNVSLNKSEGTGAAVRALIELGMIEMVGKWAEVPYWNCLGLDETSPVAQEQLREKFNTMTQTERIKWAQEALRRSNLPEAKKPGEVNGTMDESTRDAILAWQAMGNLVPTGRIDFDLYRELSSKTATLVAPPEKPVPVEQPKKAAPPPPVELQLTPDKPMYKIKDLLNVRADLQGGNGMGVMNCFYKDDRGTIARIFPNNFAPDPKVRSGQSVMIPSRGFKIQFTTPGAQEQVICIASGGELIIPANLRGFPDLAPLPVRSMDELVDAYRRDNPSIRDARLTFTIGK
jgi:peptidoglycan hydrolase-like protein with peptidoglycan-binding domain